MVEGGKKYARLTVLRLFKKEGSYRKMAECICDCGKHMVTRAESLENGNTKSCGCLHNEQSRERALKMGAVNKTHGETGTRLYRIWRSMRKRCNDTTHEAYSRYGGKGIKVCKEWEHDFCAFSKWAKENGYNETLTIDRIDNSKGYSSDNCRWVTMKVQQNNKSNNRIIEFNGDKMTLTQWGEATGLNKNIIHDRLANGWTVEEALTTPIDISKSSKYRGCPSVEVKKVVGWDYVLDAARNTVGKDMCGHEPSHQFKINILVSQHSPIQALQFRLLFKNLKSWTSVHFVRHFMGISGHWVQTQRDDRNEQRAESRDDIPQSAPVKHMMIINAQEILYISRRRLCMQASQETRDAWKMVINAIRKTEPELASVCVPECVYRGYCPEFNSCGYCNTKAYKNQLEQYRKLRTMPIEFFEKLKHQNI